MRIPQANRKIQKCGSQGFGDNLLAEVSNFAALRFRRRRPSQAGFWPKKRSGTWELGGSSWPAGADVPGNIPSQPDRFRPDPGTRGFIPKNAGNPPTRIWARKRRWETYLRGTAFSDINVAWFGKLFGKKRRPEFGIPVRPAGAQVTRAIREIGRSRADARICEFPGKKL